MSFKPFFIHSHHPSGKMPNRNPRGFTAFIAPDRVDHRSVRMSVALCSPRDQFVKATGRAEALVAEVEVVNKRLVPVVVAKLNELCNLPNQDEKDHYYLLKHVV